MIIQSQCRIRYDAGLSITSNHLIYDQKLITLFRKGGDFTFSTSMIECESGTGEEERCLYLIFPRDESSISTCLWTMRRRRIGLCAKTVLKGNNKISLLMMTFDSVMVCFVWKMWENGVDILSDSLYFCPIGC